MPRFVKITIIVSIICFIAAPFVCEMRYASWAESESLKLSAGMSRSDVIAKLGTPSSIGSWSGSAGSGEILFYEYSDFSSVLSCIQLEIELKDGKLYLILARHYWNRSSSMVLYEVKKDGQIVENRRDWNRIR